MLARIGLPARFRRCGTIAASRGAPGVSDDLVLLQRIAARDDAAVAEFYDRHSRLAFAIIRRILQSPSDAEEVLQETFVRVWSRAESYDPRLGSPAAWVVRIARNRAIDRVRARQVRADVNAPVPTADEAARARTADARNARDDDAERVHGDGGARGVAELPAPQRSS